MKFTLDFIAYQNQLRFVSPVWKFAFAIILIILSISSHPIVQFTIFLWMMFWTLGYARIPWKVYFIFLGTSLLFFLVSLPALLFEIDTTVKFSGACLYSWQIFHWTIYVTEDGLSLALGIFFRLLASLSCLLFILFTIPFLELLQVMKKMKMPQVLIDLTLVMYRFIFILIDTAFSMVIAQRARGGQATFLGKVRDMSLVVVHLFGKAMQRYNGISQGYTARGIAGEITLPPMETRPVSLRLKMECFMGCCLLLLLEGWLRWG